MAETFDYPYHLTSGENPESSFRVKFGGSYVFTTPPTDPDMRVFTLSFTGMKYYVTAGVVDDTVNPQTNMLNLINFYYRHKLYKSFIYEHPLHGTMEVKFNKPLPEPKPVKGGFGVVEDFSIELIEIP